MSNDGKTRRYFGFSHHRMQMTMSGFKWIEAFLTQCVLVQAQRQQDFPGLGQRGGPPACHLHAERWQHEGGLPPLLHGPYKGGCFNYADSFEYWLNDFSAKLQTIKVSLWMMAFVLFCWWCRFKYVWMNLSWCVLVYIQRHHIFSSRLRACSRTRAMSSCGTSTWATCSPAPPTWAPGCVPAYTSSCPTSASTRSLARSSRGWGCRSAAQVFLCLKMWG